MKLKYRRSKLVLFVDILFRFYSQSIAQVLNMHFTKSDGLNDIYINDNIHKNKWIIKEPFHSIFTSWKYETFPKPGELLRTEWLSVASFAVFLRTNLK
jgi:ABC-type microcin C transport system permease subunit YejE